MPEDQQDRREAVALFRFRLIAPAVHLSPGPERAAVLQEVAGREHKIPGSRRRRVAASTLKDWLRRYQQGKLEALYPKRRTDSNQPRRLPPEVAELLTAIKEGRAAPDGEGRHPSGARFGQSSGGSAVGPLDRQPAAQAGRPDGAASRAKGGRGPAALPVVQGQRALAKIGTFRFLP